MLRVRYVAGKERVATRHGGCSARRVPSAQQREVDPGVGLAHPAVGQMLQTRGDVEGAEVVTHADMVAELEARAEAEVGADVRVREHVEADAGVEVSPARSDRMAELGRQPEVVHRPRAAVPAAEGKVPVELQGAALEPSRVLLPLRADAPELDAAAPSAELGGDAVDGAGGNRQQEKKRADENFPHLL